jgi:hypothetical protein
VKVVKSCEGYAGRRGEPEQKAPSLIESVSGRSGRLVEELVAELQAALDTGDWEAFAELAAGARARPARYLAREFFRW